MDQEKKQCFKFPIHNSGGQWKFESKKISFFIAHLGVWSHQGLIVTNHNVRQVKYPRSSLLIIESKGSTPIIWLWIMQQANITSSRAGNDQKGSTSNTQKHIFKTPKQRSMLVNKEEWWRLNNSVISWRVITKLFQMVTNTTIRGYNSFPNSITNITKIIFTYSFIVKWKRNHSKSYYP